MLSENLAPAPSPAGTSVGKWGGRIVAFVGMAACAFIAVFLDHAARPEPPPFVPTAYSFWDNGAHIHAAGCFVGEAARSRINEQEIEVDVRGRVVEVAETAVWHFGRRNNLVHFNCHYEIVADDGDILTAIARDKDPDAVQYTLQISRKSKTVSVIERLPWGALLTADLKDGVKVYRHIKFNGEAWYESGGSI